MASKRGRFALPEPAALGTQIGLGRLGAGAMMLAAPVFGARILGADTATARRVTWLTRMTGVRDAVLGAGTFAAARRDPSAAAGWLIAGAVSDTVDGLVIVDAIRSGRLKGLLATGLVPVAAGTALAGGLAAARLRRS